MSFLAETIVAMLLEDRTDDLIAKYPELKLSRPGLTEWMEFDPSRNKKYFQWIINQVAVKKLKLPRDGEQLRDNLMTFERFLTIPEFQAPRDIFQYDAKSLSKTLKKYSGLQSKSQKDKESRLAGAKVIAQITGKGGNYQLVEITNKQELMNRAWSAYAADNPNWKGNPINPPRPGEEDDREWDGYWCVRFPNYAASYLSNGAFYLVYKNGGPYVGIVWERGECQTLDNNGISLGMAEEIYPLVRDHVVNPNELSGNCSVFNNLRFLKGEVKDGETIEPGRGGTLDLSGSSLSRLPNNLTVKGTLNVSNTALTELPQALTVKGGKLMIQGTRISKLPLDLVVDEMEWSDPLTYEETVKLYFRVKSEEMKKHYFSKNTELPPEQVQQNWTEFMPKLMNHFINSEEVARNVKVIYRYAPTTKH